MWLEYRWAAVLDIIPYTVEYCVFALELQSVSGATGMAGYF